MNRALRPPSGFWSKHATRRLARGAAAVLLLAAGFSAGCGSRPRSFAPDARPVLDRAAAEFPTGLELTVVADRLTAATALAVGPDGAIYVAERATRDSEPRLLRIDPATGNAFTFYPDRFGPIDNLLDRGPRLFGPVGGMVVHNGNVFVSGRNGEDDGVIVAFDTAEIDPATRRRPVLRTVVADLPARGDHGVTDLTVHPLTGRLYFGVGSATNSGVVGLDNWAVGWVGRHRAFHDKPLTSLKIFGYRFDTPDPAAGLLNPDKVNTAPFNPFGRSNQRIPAAEGGRASAAIYSVDPAGGDLRVEAHGLRHPRGLSFNEFGNLFASSAGMELRGTRPVKDDPDVVVHIPLAGVLGPMALASNATWFGWPDYSADLRPITDARLQPPAAMLGRTGYRELSPLIDPDASGLLPPDERMRATLVTAVLPPLSGAAGITFVPDQAPGFEPYRGRILIALHGDRAPFATSGLPLRSPQGYKLVMADPDLSDLPPQDFLINVRAGERALIHRPIALTFGSDGALYILDSGRMRLREGSERFTPGTGKILRLAAPASVPPATPANATNGPRTAGPELPED